MKKLVDQCEYVPKTENFLNILVTKKDSEVGSLQKYLKSIRKKTVERLIYILFEDEKTKMDFNFFPILINFLKKFGVCIVFKKLRKINYLK